MLIEPRQVRLEFERMPLHLIKLCCVGTDSIADLEDWIQQKLKEKKSRGRSPSTSTPRAWCQSAPRNSTDGGSLYLGDPRTDHLPRAHSRHSPLHRQGRHRPLPRRARRQTDAGRAAPALAFQGWRYLEDKEAPRDLSRAAPGAARMPETMRRELRELGLL